MPAIIFSIDSESNPVNYFAFLGYIAPRAPCVAAIGCYKGQTEKAFIMDSADFDKHVKDSGFVDGQESFLYVASGNKMESVLFYPASGKRVAIGCMRAVAPEIALASEAWTYRPDLGVYWIARKGNPDRVKKHKKPATLKSVKRAVKSLSDADKAAFMVWYNAN